MLGAENEIESQRGKTRAVLWGFLEKEGEGKSLLRDWLESKPTLHDHNVDMTKH